MLYLIRHSQAGPRGNYDELSVTGLQQAQLLGQYLAQKQISFAEMQAGRLQRQQHTAQLVNESLDNSCQVTIDERWNELQLGEIYRGLASYLCASNRQFAQDFEEMKRILNENAYAMNGAVARCDRAILQTWIEDRYPLKDHETWSGFQERINSVFTDLVRSYRQKNIAVFTSATPIVVIVGRLLQHSAEEMMEKLWGMYNSGITTLAIKDEQLILQCFNEIPHLTDPAMMTFR